jgi:beta-ribofuranosylaminobenzene 5'-phosphate synthase
MNSEFNRQSVVVKTSARLHMGFLDLNGEIGRRFGSLGLSLNVPHTTVELTVGQSDFHHSEESEYITKSKHTILDYLGINEEVNIHVHEQIPRHSGLGSGTQMALAIGAGICRLFNRSLTLQEIALILGRGLRSGIGIGTFAQGGFVIDGGRNNQTKIPPIIIRHDFPEDWPILLIFDHAHIGIHGQEELKAFGTLEDHNLATTEKISHDILLKALPALIERDLNQFGDAIAHLQAYTGDYFSPAQGGRYASKRVAQVLNFLTGRGISCVGQSSWGPTGFAIFENLKLANEYLGQLKLQFNDDQLEWLICYANNTGADMKIGNNP